MTIPFLSAGVVAAEQTVGQGHDAPAAASPRRWFHETSIPCARHDLWSLRNGGQARRVAARLHAVGLPPHAPADFLNFDNFRTFIRENNNVTWRNFNVVSNDPGDPAAQIEIDRAQNTVDIESQLPREALAHAIAEEGYQVS